MEFGSDDVQPVVASVTLVGRSKPRPSACSPLSDLAFHVGGERSTSWITDLQCDRFGFLLLALLDLTLLASF